MSVFRRTFDRFFSLLSARRRAERKLLDPSAAAFEFSTDSRMRQACAEVVKLQAPDWALEEYAARGLPSQPNVISSGYYKRLLGEYLVAARFAAGRRTLDCSCGLGWGAYLVSLKARSLFACDTDLRAVHFAKEHWVRPNLHFLAADPVMPCFPAGAFETVLAFWTVERCPRKNLERLVASIARWLAPDGVLVGVTHFIHGGGRQVAAGTRTGTFLTTDQLRSLLNPFFRDFDALDLRIFKARKR